MGKGGLPVCESMHRMCAMSAENRRGHRIPGPGVPDGSELSYI